LQAVSLGKGFPLTQSDIHDLFSITRKPREKPMSEALVFYTNPMSRGRIVRWMLEEIGQPYETVLLDYATTMKEQPYLAINPMGKVPAITHNGQIVTESAAICTYLADAFPESGLAPPVNSDLRAAYLRWMFFAAGPVEAAVGVAGLGVSVPEQKRGMVGWGSLELVIEQLDRLALQASPFLLGERFSALDVYVGSQIGFGLQFGTMPKLPSFERYNAAILTRPAAIAAKEIDEALMTG
jgi:glutathione S-transferase